MNIRSITFKYMTAIAALIKNTIYHLRLLKKIHCLFKQYTKHPFLHEVHATLTQHICCKCCGINKQEKQNTKRQETETTARLTTLSRPQALCHSTVRRRTQVP